MLGKTIGAYKLLYKNKICKIRKKYEFAIYLCLLNFMTIYRFLITFSSELHRQFYQGKLFNKKKSPSRFFIVKYEAIPI